MSASTSRPERRPSRRPRPLLLAGAALVAAALSAAGGCTTYASERAQFESRRVIVHGVQAGPATRFPSFTTRDTN